MGRNVIAAVGRLVLAKYSYIRVAAPGQRAAPQRGTVAQLERLRDWARAQAVPLADVYVDDGVERPELERLRHALWAGELDAVVCTGLDRLATGVTHLLDIWDELEAAHVDLVVLDERIDTRPAPRGVETPRAARQHERGAAGWAALRAWVTGAAREPGPRGRP